MTKNSATTKVIHWDLLLTGIFAFVLIMLVFNSPSSGWSISLRLAFGLPFVFFIPGYWLINALFPLRDDLDRVERFGLSLGLSVAWVTVLALILDRLPWGLQQWTVLLGELLFVFIFMGIALLRRVRVASQDAYVLQLILPHTWWRTQPKVNRRILLLVSVVLILAVTAATWVFLVPAPAEYMTEFYILGPEGLAENFPSQTFTEETLTVTIGIVNREKQDHAYHVEIWADDPWTEDQRGKIGEIPQFNLNVNRSIELPISWSMPWAGNDQMVEFLLFMDGQPEPYRKLRLWLNVE